MKLIQFSVYLLLLMSKARETICGSGERLTCDGKITGLNTILMHTYNDKDCHEFHEAPHIVAQLYGVPHGILQFYRGRWGWGFHKW
jgi:hypothetical protein